MTATDRPVQRVTVRTYDVLFPHNQRKARRIVVRVDTGDILRFREHGRRQWFDLSIDQAMRLAVKGTAGFVLCMVPGPGMKKKGRVA